MNSSRDFLKAMLVQIILNKFDWPTVFARLLELLDGDDDRLFLDNLCQLLRSSLSQAETHDNVDVMQCFALVLSALHRSLFEASDANVYRPPLATDDELHHLAFLLDQTLRRANCLSSL